MKVSDQMKPMKSGVDLATHSFFTKIATALQKKIEDDTGIKVAFVGKSTGGKGKMSAALTGDFTDPDPEKVEEAQKRIEILMATIKNPKSLIGLIE